VEFASLVERALSVRRRYAALETERSALFQAKEGVRAADDLDADLAHELADCLWSLVVLADRYGVDLERSFAATMDELEQRLG
jgi:NTP pyrophosphatase (non-canonical NTP hydrolase)